MLAQKFALDTPLPQVGSFGYLRGTGQRAQVIQRNAGQAGDAGRCLVKLFERRIPTRAEAGLGAAAHGPIWFPVYGSSGNTTVDEADLYASEDEALHCGRRARRGRRAR